MPIRASDLGILSREEIQEQFEKWILGNGWQGAPLKKESTLEELSITDEVITRLEEQRHISRRRFDPMRPDETVVRGFKNLLNKDWTYSHFLEFLYQEHLDNI